MPDPIPVSFESADGNGTPVEFPEEWVTETMELVPTGPRHFRLMSVPLMVENVHFGDVIEADSGPDGSLRFVRIAEPGGWRTYDFMLPAETIGSAHIIAIQDRVVTLGGHWEQVFGGVLFLCLPPTTDYDPTADIWQKS